MIGTLAATPVELQTIDAEFATELLETPTMHRVEHTSTPCRHPLVDCRREAGLPSRRGPPFVTAHPNTFNSQSVPSGPGWAGRWRTTRLSARRPALTCLKAGCRSCRFDLPPLEPHRRPEKSGHQASGLTNDDRQVGAGHDDLRKLRGQGHHSITSRCRPFCPP